MLIEDSLTVVAAALVDPHGRVLLQQRSQGRQMAGLWEFPGGKIEPGERPEAALIRELEEELGISTDQACLTPATCGRCREGGAGAARPVRRSQRRRGEPKPLDAAALQWMRPKEMFELEMPPADKPLIPILEALV